MTSRACSIHTPAGRAPLPYSSASSSSRPLITADVWNALRSAASTGQRPGDHELSSFRDRNGSELSDPRKKERIMRAIDALLRQVKRVQDAPQVAGYIAGILRTQRCGRSTYVRVKDVTLEECRRLVRDVECYCKTESSQRLQPMMALLGHLVKREVIPAGPVLTLAESLLQEIDKPFRIECVSLLLVDPSSGILTDRHYAYLMDRSLKEMKQRRRHIDGFGG